MSNNTFLLHVRGKTRRARRFASKKARRDPRMAMEAMKEYRRLQSEERAIRDEIASDKNIVQVPRSML